jgi:hypothetical protein
MSRDAVTPMTRPTGWVYLRSTNGAVALLGGRQGRWSVCCLDGKDKFGKGCWEPAWVQTVVAQDMIEVLIPREFQLRSTGS